MSAYDRSSKIDAPAIIFMGLIAAGVCGIYNVIDRYYCPVDKLKDYRKIQNVIIEETFCVKNKMFQKSSNKIVRRTIRVSGYFSREAVSKNFSNYHTIDNKTVYHNDYIRQYNFHINYNGECYYPKLIYSYEILDEYEAFGTNSEKNINES